MIFQHWLHNQTIVNHKDFLPVSVEQNDEEFTKKEMYSNISLFIDIYIDIFLYRIEGIKNICFYWIQISVDLVQAFCYI